MGTCGFCQSDTSAANKNKNQTNQININKDVGEGII